jgi:hypothetical protein
VSLEARIAEEVRALEGLGLEPLREEWRRRYGPPPRLRSSDFLARLLAWRIQAEAFGGIDPALKASLLRKSMPVPGPTLRPGMRLEREWKGRREIVDVVEGGFRWRDQTLPSLSKVASAITGTNWNGPKFFGLRDAA